MIGGRPEAVIVWRDRHGFGRGVGAYGELLGANGHLVAGAGLTFASYFGWLGLAPSLGLYHRTTGSLASDNGVVAGLFVGFRGPAILDDDLPYGSMSRSECAWMHTSASAARAT